MVDVEMRKSLDLQIVGHRTHLLARRVCIEYMATFENRKDDVDTTTQHERYSADQSVRGRHLPPDR